MPQHIKTDPRKWSSPNPTAPCIESRVPIFAPILRVSHNSQVRSGRFETPWGWVELSGPILTQEHRTILDMAIAMAVEKRVFRETGAMSVWFDTYQVKKALGQKYSGGEGHKRFLQRMEEMRMAKLTVHSKRTGRTRVSGILDGYSYTFDENNPAQFEGGIKTARSRQGDCLHEIRVSPNFMQFFKEDLRVHYHPLVQEIAKIRDGTIRAIVLFFLTHERTCHFTIRQVMKIVGGITEGMGKSTVSEIMAKPEKFKAELGNFGIFIEGETLRYERHPKVFFTNPPGARSGAVVDAQQGPEPTST